MEVLKTESLGNCRVTIRPGFEFLLTHPGFLNAIEVVKTLKPLSVPLQLKTPLGKETQFFHVRRTRHNHFDYLYAATSNGVSVPFPVLNVRDTDTHRFYLVTTYGPVSPLVDFVVSTSVTNKRKLDVLKDIAAQLIKLNKANLRHGNVVHSNIFVRRGDEVMLYDPEMDEEVLEHIQGDLEQFREMLFHLERDLDHEPASLWETVRSDPFFQNLK